MDSSENAAAATPPSLLSKTFILVESPSGRAYKESPCEDTLAETPSTIHSNSSDEHGHAKLLSFDSSECTASENEEAGKGDDSPKARVELETPPRTTSTARMMLLAAEMRNEDSPSDAGNTHSPKTIIEDEPLVVTPTRNNRSINTNSGEKSIIQPNLLFSEPETPSELTATPSQELETSRELEPAMELEPGHLTPKKAEQSTLADEVSSCSGSSSDCPFDCVEDYRKDTIRSSPEAIEVASNEEEKAEPVARIKAFSRAYKALKSSVLWVASGKGASSKEILDDLSKDPPAPASPTIVVSKATSPDGSTEDVEVGLQGDDTPPRDLLIVPTKSTDPEHSEAESYGEGVERVLFPEDIGSFREPSRKKRNWGTILFYFAVIVCVVAIVVFASLLLVQKRQQASTKTAGSVSNGSAEAADLVTPSEEQVPPQSEVESGPPEDPEIEVPGPEEPATDPDPLEPEVADGTIVPQFVLVGENEICSNAVILEDINIVYRGTTAQSPWDATVDGCGDSMAIGYGAWWKFTPSSDILVEASTCGRTEFDTQITIFSGECGELRCEAFNDQSCGDQSRVTWLAERNKVYYVLVNGYRDSNGEYELTLSPAAYHDTCPDAKGPVSIGSTQFGTTAGSMPVHLPRCIDMDFDATKPGVWYLLDNNAVGWVRAAVLARDPNFVAQIAVFSGDDCDALQCVVASNDGSVNWRADSTKKNYIYVSSSTDQTGSFDLYLVNDYDDTCENALDFYVGNVAFELSSSLARPHSVPSCGTESFLGQHSAPGIWFAVTGTGGVLEASTCNEDTTLDTEVSVFQGACGALECVGGSGQNRACSEEGKVSWPTELGRQYLVFVSGHASRTGTFWLKIDETESERGSVCVSPFNIGPSSSAGGSTEGALDIPSCGNFEDSKGVWYEFEGTGHIMDASLCAQETTFDARISLFSGSCGSLECMGHTTETCGDNGSIQWVSAVDKSYFILVHGADSSSAGDYQLRIEDATLNDSCERAVGLATRTHSFFGSNTDAELDDSVSCDRRRSEARGIWYSFVGSGNEVTFSTCSEQTDFDTEIEVFTGSCDDLTCVDSARDGCGNQAAITLQTEEDTVYFVRIRGADVDKMGNFAVGVSVANSQFGW